MKAYVINLVRCPDRRTQMVAELHKTGLTYELIEAVDGREFDLTDGSVVSPISLGRGPIRDGTWGGTRSSSAVMGCALSHYNVYRRILQDGIDVGLVFEDDLRVHSEIGDIAAAVAAHMTGAEVALMQWSNVSAAPRHALRLNRTTAIQLPTSRVLAYPVQIQDVAGAGAYLVTRAACASLTKVILPVRVPADDWSFFFAQGGLDRLRCVAPAPVKVDPRIQTTIDHVVPRSPRGLLRHHVADKVPAVRDALAQRRHRMLTEAELVDESADQWLQSSPSTTRRLAGPL